ncbi:MAG: hypothetical protein CFE25_17650 [Chitinophagaceae bacterium BSSC1]|nr:MAG: hypothetical protein CFE25_17650 [Chitinophagaceae bacterium BSSC1]
MKQKTIAVIVMTMALLACQNQSTTSNTIDTNKTTIDSIQSLATYLTGCYEYNVGQDTIRLTLKVNGTNVSGELFYDMYEKDKSRGTLDGLLKDSIIETNYAFNSEGMDSDAEVIFKFKNDSLYMGEGPQGVKDGKGVFLDKSKIQFTAAFRKIKCP